MSTHRKLMTVCCAAVFALGLAACGSSDDNDTAMEDPVVEPMPDPMPTPTEQLAAAEQAVSSAQMAVDGLTVAS